MILSEAFFTFESVSVCVEHKEKEKQQDERSSSLLFALFAFLSHDRITAEWPLDVQ